MKFAHMVSRDFSSFVFFFDLTVLDPLFLLLLTVLPHVDPPSDSVTLFLVSSIVNTSGVLIRGEHNTDMACTKTPIQQFL